MERAGGSVALVEDVLGCKWTLELLGALARAQCRPGQLRRAVPGISVKVLNERLAKLLRFGVVERRVVPSRRLHVEYRLTPKGRELARLMTRILDVCARWDAATGSGGEASWPRLEEGVTTDRRQAARRSRHHALHGEGATTCVTTLRHGSRT